MASSLGDISVVAVKSPTLGGGVEVCAEEGDETGVVFVTGHNCMDDSSNRPGSGAVDTSKCDGGHDRTTGSQNRDGLATQQTTVTLSSDTDSKLEELWKRVENVMVSRQSSVQQVMEEFGITFTDAQPASQELEEQVWQVVEGELTMQEAADLV